jgi:regulator of sigma E protease
VTLLVDFLGYLVPFLVVLTVLVFVHELGHFWVARRAGVRVEVFSIGFGPEIWHRIDAQGTRWRLAWIPIGGYVKFFGDADPASATAGDQAMSEAEKAVSFHHKPLSARSAIVLAGPLANLLFAVLAFAALAMTVGLPHTAPIVGAVQEGSAAAAAGLRPGDRFVSIEGSAVERFQDLQRIVRLRPEMPVRAVVERDGQALEIVTTPKRSVMVDRFGNRHEIGLLGISQSGVEMRRYGPLDGLWFGLLETWQAMDTTLTAVGQMIVGARGTEDLGGPLRIAQMSGQMAEVGAPSLVTFMAYLSISLGLLNLFPIPLLDGGHLVYYLLEALRGRPLGPKAQEYGFRIGIAFVGGLFLLATWNDRDVIRRIAQAVGGLF